MAKRTSAKSFDPNIIAAEIVEDLPPSKGYSVTSQAALAQFAEVATDFIYGD